MNIKKKRRERERERERAGLLFKKNRTSVSAERISESLAVSQVFGAKQGFINHCLKRILENSGSLRQDEAGLIMSSLITSLGQGKHAPSPETEFFFHSKRWRNT